MKTIQKIEILLELQKKEKTCEREKKEYIRYMLKIILYRGALYNIIVLWWLLNVLLFRISY